MRCEVEAHDGNIGVILAGLSGVKLSERLAARRAVIHDQRLTFGVLHLAVAEPALELLGLRLGRLEQRRALACALSDRTDAELAADAGTVVQHGIEDLAHLRGDLDVQLRALKVLVERPHPVGHRIEGVALTLRVDAVVDVPHQAVREALFRLACPAVLGPRPALQRSQLYIAQATSVFGHGLIEHHQADGVGDLLEACGEVGVAQARDQDPGALL